MADSGIYDPETVARHQRIADTLLKQAAAPREIRSRLQGIGQLGEGLIAGLSARGADQESKDARAAMIAQGLQAYGIGAPAGAAPAAVPDAAPPVSASDPSQPPTTLVGNNPQIPASGGGDPASAIANIESGGSYNLVGPATRGDRPYGKYQVMGANIPAWTKEHLGQALTPQQFLASPEAQDAVFKGQFGKYSQKYGPEGAAKAWFAGEGGMNNPNARDILGTTVASYADRFNKGMGGPPAIAAALNAPPSAPPVQVASTDAGPASFADRFAAANGARPPAAPPMAAPPPPVAAALNAPPPQQAPSPAGGAPGVAAALNAPVQVAQNIPQQGSREAQVRFGLNPWTPPAAAAAVLGQLTPKPQAMKITNRDGSESIVFVDPNKGTITGSDGKPISSGAVGGGMPHPEMSGEQYGEFIQKTDPGRANLITQMHNGEIAPAQLGRYGNKAVQSLIEDAARIHPGFSQLKWEGAVKAQRELSSASPSALGGRLQALNNSIDHLLNTSDAAIKSGNVDAGNVLLSGPINTVRSTTTHNQDLINTINREAEIYGGERTKFLTGRSGSKEERLGFKNEIGASTAAKPAMAGVIEGEITQLEDAVKNQEQQLKDNAGEGFLKSHPVVAKEVAAKIERIKENIKILRGEKEGVAPAASGNTASAPIKVSSPEEARKLPKGTAIILPDGSPGVVP